MDAKQLFVATNTLLLEAVQQIADDQWQLPVLPHMQYKDGFVLKDFVNVCAYENQCVPKMLNGETGLTTNADLQEDLLGIDPEANYELLSQAADEAVQGHEKLDQIVHMSYAEVPAEGYLTDISVQRSSAAYDIAALTGSTVHLADESVAALTTIVAKYADYLREMNIFPAEVHVDQDRATAEDKLMAMMGRQPYDSSIVI